MPLLVRGIRVQLELIDLALRGAGTGIALILCVQFWFSRIAFWSRVAFLLLALSSLSRLWGTLPPMTSLEDPVLSLLKTLAAGGAFSVTWFLLSIFLDDKRFAWAWLASGAAVSLGLFCVRAFPEIAPFLRAYALVHFVALAFLFVQSAKGDLQDARRRIRPMMTALFLLHSISSAITSTVMDSAQEIIPALGHAIKYFVTVALLAVWSLKANIDQWPGETEVATGPTPVQRFQDQSLLISRIQTEMKAGVWQIEGLTVSALALRVKAPEHQVRRAINQVLGHRNFASFINSARIDAAKDRLSAPESTEQTILEIAYDVGFASLGPFNRAFRDATGLSPSDYRRQSLGGIRSDST